MSEQQRRMITTSEEYGRFIDAATTIQEQFGTTILVATLAATLTSTLQRAKDKQGALSVIASMMADIAAMPEVSQETT